MIKTKDRYKSKVEDLLVQVKEKLHGIHSVCPFGFFFTENKCFWKEFVVVWKFP